MDYFVHFNDFLLTALEKWLKFFGDLKEHYCNSFFEQFLNEKYKIHDDVANNKKLLYHCI